MPEKLAHLFCRRTCHEKGWETTKLGCRHFNKTKPEKLVNGKSTVHVGIGIVPSSRSSSLLKEVPVPKACGTDPVSLGVV